MSIEFAMGDVLGAGRNNKVEKESTDASGSGRETRQGRKQLTRTPHRRELLIGAAGNGSSVWNTSTEYSFQYSIRTVPLTCNGVNDNTGITLSRTLQKQMMRMGNANEILFLILLIWELHLKYQVSLC